MIKIYKTSENNKLVQLGINEAVSGSWFNLINPSDEEINKVSLILGLDEDFLRNSLDVNERSRIEIDNGNILVITNIPIMVEDDGSFDTLPLGIVLTPTCVITVCSQENNIISSFNKETSHFFNTMFKTNFMLKILYRSAKFYLKYLGMINRATDVVEEELQKTTNNKALFQLIEVQKTLVYFSTALKDNDLVLQKIARMTKQSKPLIKTNEEDDDLLEDVIIENKQAIEMVEMHRTILESMMDGFASIINNNLNLVIKFLTATTIILSIPTMIGGLWGMNVPVPFGHNPYGFLFILLVSILAAIATVFFFKRKGMF